MTTEMDASYAIRDGAFKTLMDSLADMYIDHGMMASAATAATCVDFLLQYVAHLTGLPVTAIVVGIPCVMEASLEKERNSK